MNKRNHSLYYEYSSLLFCACIMKVFTILPIPAVGGLGSSSGNAFVYGLDGPGSTPGVGGVEIFHYFVSRLFLGPLSLLYK